MYKITIPTAPFEYIEITTGSKNMSVGINKYFDTTKSELLNFFYINFRQVYIKHILFCVDEIKSTPLPELIYKYTPVFKNIDLALINQEQLYCNIFAIIVDRRFSHLEKSIKNYVDKL